MRHPISRWSAVAACAAILLTWLLVPGQQSTASAFNAFATAIVTAKSARFDAEVTIVGQPKQTFKSSFLAPGKYRQEFPSAVNIIDFEAKKIVTLMPEQKKATIMNFTGDRPQDAASDWFERMRDLLAKGQDADAERDRAFVRLGEQEIDGVHTIGFRLDTPAAMVTMWGDPATGQPVRIENVFSGIPRTEVVMSHFDLNVELDPALFDATPPADFSVQSFDVDTSPPAEADLIEGLRASAEINGGEFLSSIDTTGVQQAIIQHAVKLGRGPTDAEMQALMKQSIAIGRGYGFLLSRRPAEIEAYYAGKGIKIGAAATPIVWYKLADQAAYRVIYADLSVQESPLAPAIPGAVRIENTSQGLDKAQP